MKSNRGFTLIEMAVVLAIIAILAAILTPIVTGYIDQARTTRANEDVSKIASAVLLYYRDTTRFPIYDSTALAVAGNPSKGCMVSGTTNLLPTVVGLTNDASWTSAPASCSGANIGVLRSYLNVNTLGVTTGNPANGLPAFRGPYLDGLDQNDPWGQPYVVTSFALGNNVQNLWAFVISAGPNQKLDTVANQNKTSTTLSTGGDDITALIR